MNDDIIRIDGVEYEPVGAVIPSDWPEHGGKHVYLRPKREQTGLRCDACGFGVCYHVDKDAAAHMWDDECPVRHSAAKWQPFYGKVVE